MRSLDLRHALIVSLFAVAPVAALAQAQQSTPSTTPPPATSAPNDADLPDAPDVSSHVLGLVTPTGPTVIFDTSMGRLTCKLYDKQTPKTTANFIGLAEGTKDWTDPVANEKVHGKRFYDGTTFHRVIPGFMIQGGDRLGTGMGDAGYLFEDEIDPTLSFDQPGMLAMANSGPGTNGSQFFITDSPASHLNGKHTIFGHCDEHTQLMVQTIEHVRVDSNDKPATPVTVDHVYIVRDGQPIPPDPMAAAPTGAPASSVPPPSTNAAPPPHR